MKLHLYGSHDDWLFNSGCPDSFHPAVRCDLDPVPVQPSDTHV